MSKYRSRKTEVDGILFDSKKEAERYKVLKQMEQDGRISELHLQAEFILIPSQKYSDMPTERAVKYRVDFYYFDEETLRWTAEDVKGFRTKDYIIKRKLLKYKFPYILFKEIT